MRNLIASLKSKPVTGSHRVLRIAAFAIFASAAVLLVIIVLGRTEQAETACRKLSRKQVEIVKGKSGDFIKPVTGHLQLLAAYGSEGILNLSSPDTIGKVLIPPTINSLNHVTSAIFIDSYGTNVLLTRSEGNRQAAEKTESTSDHEEPAWLKTTRKAEPCQVQWTNNGLDVAGSTTGFTASILWNTPDDHWQAAALCISNDAMVNLVNSLPISENSEVLLLSAGKDVLRISCAVNGNVEVTSRDIYFTEQRDPTAEVRNHLQKVISGGLIPEPFAVMADKKRIWWSFTNTDFGDQTRWLALSTAEDDLLADFHRDEEVLVNTLLVIILAGVIAVIAQAYVYGIRIRNLSSRRKHSARSEEDTLALIAQGEHEQLEFKSTLRWNLKADKADKVINHSWLKTLAAFMNTDGGTLLVGVEDNANILGIEADRFPNEDKYLLHFNNMFKKHIGLEHSALIAFGLVPLGEKKILVVDIEPATIPVFLKHGTEEEFFVRVGPGTRPLPTSKVLEYVRNR